MQLSQEISFVKYKLIKPQWALKYKKKDSLPKLQILTTPSLSEHLLQSLPKNLIKSNSSLNINLGKNKLKPKQQRSLPNKVLLQNNQKKQSLNILHIICSSKACLIIYRMPAVSPTMTEGKILKWKIKLGDSFDVGDALFSIETDKAIMDYQATEKGILAKILAQENETLPIGKSVAVAVKKAENVLQFNNFTEEQVQQASTSSPTVTLPSQAPHISAPSSSSSPSGQTGSRVIASPLAKTLANQKGINLSEVKGSGPSGRIIKQDIE